MEWAVLILNTSDPVLKVGLSPFPLLITSMKYLIGRAYEARSTFISYRTTNLSWAQIKAITTATSDPAPR